MLTLGTKREDDVGFLTLRGGPAAALRRRATGERLRVPGVVDRDRGAAEGSERDEEVAVEGRDRDVVVFVARPAGGEGVEADRRRRDLCGAGDEPPPVLGQIQVEPNVVIELEGAERRLERGHPTQEDVERVLL